MDSDDCQRLAILQSTSLNGPPWLPGCNLYRHQFPWENRRYWLEGNPLHGLSVSLLLQLCFWSRWQSLPVSACNVGPQTLASDHHQENDPLATTFNSKPLPSTLYLWLSPWLEQFQFAGLDGHGGQKIFKTKSSKVTKSPKCEVLLLYSMHTLWQIWRFRICETRTIQDAEDLTTRFIRILSRWFQGNPYWIPLDPKTMKMKVLHPELWVITPKNEGCGFPWYAVVFLNVGRFSSPWRSVWPQRLES